MNERISNSGDLSRRPIRVGVLGCGRISKKHLAALSKNRSYELAAVCDSDNATLKDVKNSQSVPGFSNLGEMLSAVELDLVVICTPSGLHARQAVEAGRAGCHVLTEKPMAVKWDDAKWMVREFDGLDVKLFVVKQNRVNPTISKLKGAIDGGHFGHIRLLVANVFWSRPQSYYDQNDGWRGTWKMDGGAVFNQASHYVDLLRWLGGPIRSTFVTSTTARDIQTEDTFSATFDWQRGAIGSLNVTMLTYPKNLEGSITVLGDRGTARVGGLALNEMCEWTFEDSDFEKSTSVNVSYEAGDVYGNGHVSYYEELDKFLREGHGEVSEACDAIQTVELLCAMQRSARDGRPCHLPLDL